MSRFAYLQQYNQAAAKIQNSWKGRKIRIKAKNKDANSGTKQLQACQSDAEMLHAVSQQLDKGKLTLDRVFRVGDTTMCGTVPALLLLQQIESFGVKCTEDAKNMLLAIFDEDGKNEITYEELIDIGDSYGVEYPTSYICDYISMSKRALITFVETLNNKGVDAEQIFTLNNQEVISISDFAHFIDEMLKLKLKKREFHALTVLFSSKRTQLISKSEFLDIIQKGQKLVDKLLKSRRPKELDSFDLSRNRFSRTFTQLFLNEHEYITHMKSEEKSTKLLTLFDKKAEQIKMQLAVSEVEYVSNTFLAECFNHI